MYLSYYSDDRIRTISKLFSLCYISNINNPTIDTDIIPHFSKEVNFFDRNYKNVIFNIKNPPQALLSYNINKLQKNALNRLFYKIELKKLLCLTIVLIQKFYAYY